jgi:hypothetical protein
MPEVFETKSFTLPSEIRDDLATRLKQAKGVRSLEISFKGDDLHEAKMFAAALLALKKQGAKISHQFSIKIELPRGITRERIMALVMNLPKPVNGSVKVNVQTEK